MRSRIRLWGLVLCCPPCWPEPEPRPGAFRHRGLPSCRVGSRSAFAADSLPRRLAGANGPAIGARWVHAPLRSAGVRAGKPPCPGIGPPQLRPQVALLFSGGAQYLVGFVFFGERSQEQQDVKKEAFDFGEISIRAMVPGVRVIGWALGGRLRQCPQRLVVEPTGGVKGDRPFLVRAKPAVKVKPIPSSLPSSVRRMRLIPPSVLMKNTAWSSLERSGW